MSIVRHHNIFVEPQGLDIRGDVESILREEHGAHGLRFMGATALFDLQEPVHMSLSESTTPGSHDITYRHTDTALRTHTVASGDQRVLAEVLSDFAISNLGFTLEQQSSRPDKYLLAEHVGNTPNLTLDPSKWIADNPFISDLHRRFPKYGNLIRYVCNERGLFLKLGNYPDQRAYWNSTTNGGLPIFKKADPVHEGTFMLHDLFHFIPTDPVIGSETPTRAHKATYLAHRLISEASTLVMADMVAVDDAGLKEKGYDTGKRRIYPVYESVADAKGEKPNADKLLAANVYFCLTGNAVGFEMLGASPESISGYREKYEAIFKDDFMWNLNNYEAMVDEQTTNPDVAAYYEWLTGQPFVPHLDAYTQRLYSPDEGLAIADMLSLFRADFTNALNYQQPLDDMQRIKKSALKYAAGQRIIYARFNAAVSSSESTAAFDNAFASVFSARNSDDVVTGIEAINKGVSDYVDELLVQKILLPHQANMYKFSAPAYPVRFVNYDCKKEGSTAKLNEEMANFIAINGSQLQRLLDIVEA